jgi:hypothetical protein
MMIAALISDCRRNLKRKSNMLSRFALATLAAALSVTPVIAQVRGGRLRAGFGISAGSPAMGRGGPAGGDQDHFHQGRAFGRGAVLLPYADFYSDSNYYTGAIPQQQPQIIVVQSATPAPVAEPPAPRESLLIELQGDRFVRTTMSAGARAGSQAAPADSEKSVVPSSEAGQSRSKPNNASEPVRELLPAVLVFHDGRKEEVSEYTIMNGTIYSKADYWTTGSWTRKVAIADLDVPATLKLNQERGSKFMLPASPNEVVVRP